MAIGKCSILAEDMIPVRLLNVHGLPLHFKKGIPLGPCSSVSSTMRWCFNASDRTPTRLHDQLSFLWMLHQNVWKTSNDIYFGQFVRKRLSRRLSILESIFSSRFWELAYISADITIPRASTSRSWRIISSSLIWSGYTTLQVQLESLRTHNVLSNYLQILNVSYQCLSFCTGDRSLEIYLGFPMGLCEGSCPGRMPPTWWFELYGSLAIYKLFAWYLTNATPTSLFGTFRARFEKPMFHLLHRSSTLLYHSSDSIF